MAFKKDQFHKDILEIIRRPKPVEDGRGLLDKMLGRVRQPGIKPPRVPKIPKV